MGEYAFQLEFPAGGKNLRKAQKGCFLFVLNVFLDLAVHLNKK